MALESVALDELEARAAPVSGGIVVTFVTLSADGSGGVITFVVVGAVVVVGLCFGVAATGTKVVEVEVAVGRVVVREASWVARWGGGVELDEAVKVKTRTKRRTGLDHITQ
ncbi:MAG: hypothetical protein ABSG58_05535 [Acidimicrobiales bacterium]